MTSPVCVVIRASETPFEMTEAGPVAEGALIPSKVVNIPLTVPSKPTKGAVVIRTKANGIRLSAVENISSSIWFI